MKTNSPLTAARSVQATAKPANQQAYRCRTSAEVVGNMERLLKLGCLLPVVAFLLGLGGCSDRANPHEQDAQIQRKIVGTWSLETNRVDGIMTFHPDGRFSGYWSNTVASRGWRCEGEWRITNGDCAMVIASKAAWNYTLHGPTGTVERMRILRLDDQQLVAASDEQTNKWTRRK